LSEVASRPEEIPACREKDTTPLETITPTPETVVENPMTLASQEHQHIALVLARIRTAMRIVAAETEGAIEFGYFDQHLQNPPPKCGEHIRTTPVGPRPVGGIELSE
jgi:hypothetical protein